MSHLERCDLNYAEAMRELTRRAGGVVLDEDGLLFFASTHPFPVLANGVMRTANLLAAAEVLARAEAFFTARARGYSVMIRAHADQDLHDAATAAGLQTMGDAPGMVLAQRLRGAPPPAGVTLERVATPAAAAAFADVMARSYATYGMPADVAPAALGKLAVHVGPHIVSLLARLDGNPVAGAMVIVTHGVAGVYWVGTVPEARGRGLAELVTRAVGNAGFEQGAGIASLQASIMGAPVYRRMGYVDVTNYPTLVRFRSRRSRPSGE